MKDFYSLYEWTIDLLAKKSIRYSVYNLPSGIIIIDVWHNRDFYVLQFEGHFIGFSKIDDENLGFDTNPDKKIYEESEYKQCLNDLLR